MTAAAPIRTTYRPAEIAALLDISLSTVYRRLEDGSMPSIRVGKQLRIPIEEFHRLYPAVRR